MGRFSCLGGKSARRVRLMFVGLDGAGKSTLLQTIARDPEEPTVPTVGFHNVALRRERTFDSGFDVDVFDLGGGKRIRGIWKHYVADVHACVFVVDSADSKRAEEEGGAAGDHRDPRLTWKPVAVFANKQDLPGARSEAEVAKALGLDTVGNARYRVIACTSLLDAERATGRSQRAATPASTWSKNGGRCHATARIGRRSRRASFWRAKGARGGGGAEEAKGRARESREGREATSRCGRRGSAKA